MNTEEKKRLLLDTAHTYGADPKQRAKHGDLCAYRTPDGRRCALGRLLSTDELDEIDRAGHNDGTSASGLSKAELLPDRFDDPDTIAFLEFLQDFHDEDENWGPKGLTTAGLAYARRIAFKHEFQVTDEELQVPG